MKTPESLWRSPSRAAIDALAKRFDLPNDPGMQDWEYEVADPDRLQEFMAAYQYGSLNDDELFVLMIIMVQSLELSPTYIGLDERWYRLREWLETRMDLHIYTVWYWADFKEEDPGCGWRLSPYMREILNKSMGKIDGEGF